MILIHLVVIEPAQLTHMEYIADDAAMSAPSSAKESTREEAGAAKKEDRPPIGVTLKYDIPIYPLLNVPNVPSGHGRARSH